jgi:hypothetical protein
MSLKHKARFFRAVTFFKSDSGLPLHLAGKYMLFFRLKENYFFLYSLFQLIAVVFLFSTLFSASLREAAIKIRAST